MTGCLGIHKLSWGPWGFAIHIHLERGFPSYPFPPNKREQYSWCFRNPAETPVEVGILLPLLITIGDIQYIQTVVFSILAGILPSINQYSSRKKWHNEISFPPIGGIQMMPFPSKWCHFHPNDAISQLFFELIFNTHITLRDHLT